MICFCYNDLVYYNFLVKNKEISIIDFDFMILDLRIMDVVDFILKFIKNVVYDVNKMFLVIEGYESVNSLKNEEKELLYIFLEFFEDFYNIFRDYYYKRKNWDYDVYLSRLKVKLDNESFRYEFLEVYKLYLI